LKRQRKTKKPLVKDAAGFYLSSGKRLLKKIPKVVWGFFAIVGILFVGMLVGYESAQEDTTLSPIQQIRVRNERYSQVIQGYEELANLYFEQGENLKIVLDKDMILQNPHEVVDAFRSMDQYRSLINIQMGRLLELRREAGLSGAVKSF